MKEMKDWHAGLLAVSAFIGPVLIMELLRPHIGGWSGLFLIGGYGLVYVWHWTLKHEREAVRQQMEGEARYLCAVCDITYPLQRSACPVCSRSPDQERRLR